MSDVSQTLVIGHLWQSVALAAVLAAVFIFGKRMRGATRYGLASAAFVASLVLPLAAFIPGETIVSGLLKQITPAPVASPAKPVVTALVAAPIAAAPVVLPPKPNNPMITDAVWNAVDARVAAVVPAVTATAPVKAAPWFTVPEIKLPDIGLPLLAIWLTGVAIMLARTLRDLIAVERLVKRAKPAVLPEALKRRFNNVRVAVSAEAPGPMAAGLFRPCIVLPESIALASPGMAALLEHERAHIERRDMLAALGQRIVLALLWWSPALYWVSRRIDEEREVACDEAAVDRTGDAKAFARSLTTQAQNQLWARAPKLAVGAIGPRSQFGRRIRRLIDIAKTGASPAKYSGRLAFAGLVLAVGVAAMVTPRFAASAQELDGQPGSAKPKSGAIDIKPGDKADKAKPGKDEDGDYNFHFKFDGDDQDWAAFGEEFGKLMESVGDQIRVSMAELSPELQQELAGLSTDMAALGVDISTAAGEAALAQMPEIMDHVRESLEAAGIDIDDQDWQRGKGFNSEELKRELDQARQELKEKLGPEMQAKIREAMEEARAEIAAHKDEIAAAMRENQAGLAIAREAMAQARKEIDAARERGDFKYKGNWKDGDQSFNFKFDGPNGFDGQKLAEQIKAQLRAAGIPVDGHGAIAIGGNGAIAIDGRDRGRNGSWQLYRAASRCDAGEVSKLIDGNADVNEVKQGDGTALIIASAKGCLDAVRALLDHGADANLASRGDGNPLIAAAAGGHVDVARLLLERGANANGSSQGDGSPLIVAAATGHQDVAQLLLSRGADVNGYVPGDETPLMAAAERGKLDLVKFLVEHGAKVNLAYNVTNRWGDQNKTELRSPLNMAMKHGHDDVAAYLRSKGAVENPPAAN